MTVKFLMAAFTVVFFLTGCGGSASKKGETEMPDFVLNPPQEEGALYGSGVSEQSSEQLAKETADARACKEIAATVGTRVSSVLKDFMGQAGISDTGAEITEFVQSVTKSLTDIELTGCSVVKREQANGKLYSLAKYPLDPKAREMIKGVVKENLSSREALLSSFRAQKGFEELEKELQNLQ
ncbi:MAG: hypothetical protein ACLFQK_05450 [Fibrobacterota bacterium]